MQHSVVLEESLVITMQDRKKFAAMIKSLGTNVPIDAAVRFLQRKGFRFVTKDHLRSLPNWHMSGGFLRPDRVYFDDDVEGDSCDG